MEKLKEYWPFGKDSDKKIEPPVLAPKTRVDNVSGDSSRIDVQEDIDE